MAVSARYLAVVHPGHEGVERVAALADPRRELIGSHLAYPAHRRWEIGELPKMLKRADDRLLVDIGRIEFDGEGLAEIPSYVLLQEQAEVIPHARVRFKCRSAKIPVLLLQV